MAASILAFMARIDEGIAGCRVAMDARGNWGRRRGKTDMWGRRVSERGKEEASAGWVGFCWAAAGRARGEGRWATAGCWLDRLGPFGLFFFF